MESRSEQLRKETYYVSSESKEGEISSYQGSDESYDENDQKTTFDGRQRWRRCKEQLYGFIASKIWGHFLSFFGPFGPTGPFGSQLH